MPSKLSPAALHTELPTECASTNVVVDLARIEYPGISGTGFFARRDRKVFYFTALHCMRTNPVGETLTFATLMVPYRHTGHTNSPDDFIQVDSGFTIGGSAPDEWLDLIAFPVPATGRTNDFQYLLARCAKLPSSGAWLEEYIASEHGGSTIMSWQYSAYAVGHPQGSPRNAIDYADKGGESVVSAEAVVLEGKIAQSNLQGHLPLRCDPSPYGFPGFSGAPVFAPIDTPTGRRFALIGMAVCGSPHALNFLPVGRLVDAVASDA